MAIRTRRGNNADFDPNKLLSGEPATVLDDGKIKWCISPGNVKTVATVEDMTEAISEANQAIIDELTAGANAVANVVEGVLDGVNNLIDSNGKYYTIKVDNGELYLEEIEPDPSPPISQTILDDIADLQDGKVDKTSIVQNTTVNDPAKIPSSAVTHGLQEEINDIDEDLSALASAIGALRLVQKGENGATAQTVTFTAVNSALYLFVAARAVMGHGCMYLIRSAGGNASFTPIKENTDICALSNSGLTISINLKQSYTVYSIIRLADL